MAGAALRRVRVAACTAAAGCGGGVHDGRGAGQWRKRQVDNRSLPPNKVHLWKVLLLPTRPSPTASSTHTLSHAHLTPRPTRLGSCPRQGGHGAAGTTPPLTRILPHTRPLLTHRRSWAPPLT